MPAATQFHLDVYGEVADALHYARRMGLEANGTAFLPPRDPRVVGTVRAVRSTSSATAS